MADSFNKRFLRAYKLYEVRLGRNVRHEEFAKTVAKAGRRKPPNASTVGRWKDDNVPDLATIALISKVLDVDPGWLAFGEASGKGEPEVPGKRNNGGRKAG